MKVFFAIAALAATSLPASADEDWKLIWSDEFDAPNDSAPNPTNWVYDLGGNGWGNNELQTYTDRRANSRIENGMLIIEALKEKFTGKDGKERDYTSARLKTLGKQSWTYGRIEARMKLPQGQGIWPAFWMMGDDVNKVGWPRCGEIDIMEHIGKEPAKVFGTIHGPGYSGAKGIGGNFTFPDARKLADDFHTFAIEWQTNKIDWLIDGHRYFTITPEKLPAGQKWVFDKPHFILLNLAIGGNWPGMPDATTALPQKLIVDYVRVFASQARDR